MRFILVSRVHSAWIHCAYGSQQKGAVAGDDSLISGADWLRFIRLPPPRRYSMYDKDHARTYRIHDWELPCLSFNYPSRDQFFTRLGAVTSKDLGLDSSHSIGAINLLISSCPRSLCGPMQRAFLAKVKNIFSATFFIILLYPPNIFRIRSTTICHSLDCLSVAYFGKRWE